MRQTGIILIIACWISLWFAPLRAQTAMGTFQQQLIPARLSESESAAFKPVQLERTAAEALPDFRIYSAWEQHVSLSRWEPDILLREYYRGLFGQYVQPQQAEEGFPIRPTVNRAVFHSLYNAGRVDDEDLVRRQWQEAFGFDVWFTYYKAKEVEDWVKQRLTVRLGKLKGEPLVDRTRVFYTFKSRF